MTFDVYEYSNQGGREYNEDCADHAVHGSSGIFVVADGLGGHRYGDMASSIVCETLTDGWQGDFGGNPSAWLVERITMANSRILDTQIEKNAVLKSTAVALAVDHGKACWGNSGDSRLYYIHNNRLAAYTNDHSVAYKKYKSGEITRAQIATDEDQTSLLKAIGSADRFEPEIYDYNIMVESGDAFMLCSDGVWEYLADDEILIDMLKSQNAKDWAEHMLLRIIDRVDGHHDNLTVLTVMVI